MRILLVGNYQPDKQESMQRFADLMQRELQECGHSARLIRPRRRLNRAQHSAAGIPKWLGYVDKFVLFPLQLRQVIKWADVVHICDHSNSLYVRTLRIKPHIITCNDVLAIRSALGEIPDNPTRRSGKILQKLILSGLNHAQHIVCISNNTRAELLHVSDVDPRRASVVYMGLNFPYAPLEREVAWPLIAEALTQPKRAPFPFAFLLHIGGNQWYKNRLGVLRIYQRLRLANGARATPKLVMAGHPLDEEMRGFIAQNDLQDDVIEVQGCSNEALQAFYSMAEVMLFPSLAEGFGWPVVEAQACGCRVVTSNFAPLTEIGGEAAIYCDPRNEAEVARQLQEILAEDSQTRRHRVESGISNAQRFSARQMTENYLAVYREVIVASAP